MSNFLQLCQDLRQEAGFTGSGPTSVANQTGQYSKVVKWVNSAYMDVITEHNNWDFLWGQTEIDTVIGTSVYSHTVLVDRWKDAVIHEKAVGHTDDKFMVYLPYQEFYSRFELLHTETGRPAYFTERPDGKVEVHPVPDKIYTVNADYYQTPVALVANTDLPLIPTKFHDVILYKALAKATANSEDFNSYQYAERQADAILGRMERDLLPTMVITPRPIA